MSQTFDKEALRKAFEPRAALVAMSDKAADAIPPRVSDNGAIPIYRFPFRIGRESRVRIDERGNVVVMERLKHSLTVAPTNDLYLVDAGERLQISRDHLHIVEEEGRFFVIDDGSTCGTGVEEERIGAATGKERVEIRDGETLVIGKPDSPYRYRFVLFDTP